MKKNNNHIKGQGLTEYIIIVSLIAVGAIAIFTLYGSQLSGKFTSITSSISDTASNAGGQALESGDENALAEDEEVNRSTTSGTIESVESASDEHKPILFSVLIFCAVLLAIWGVFSMKRKD